MANQVVEVSNLSTSLSRLHSTGDRFL